MDVAEGQGRYCGAMADETLARSSAGSGGHRGRMARPLRAEPSASSSSSTTWSMWPSSRRRPIIWPSMSQSRGSAEFAIVFSLIWIAWVNGSLYIEIHGRDDGRTRIIVFAQMGRAGVVGGVHRRRRGRKRTGLRHRVRRCSWPS